jgi:transposase
MVMGDPTLYGGTEADFPLRPDAKQDQHTGRPRLRPVQRHQIEMRCQSLDQLLPPEHSARTVWAFVEAINILPLLAPIKAVADSAGRDANDPRVLLALWLFATLQGVGSARELERLCDEHLAYQWLCGGMSVNYHSLADFRVQQVEFLDQLLTDSVAAMLHQGLVDLQQVAQDGMKVRASAGSSSFRREKSLQECLVEAQQQVAALRNQANEDATAAARRQQVARQRAANERLERVQAALVERQKLLELRQAQKKEGGVKFEPEQLRASTTDPEARRMKMADGGTRPAYNVQLATSVKGGVIVGVEVSNSGGDSGQLGPMLEQLQERYEQKPEAMLVDGSFATHRDIETAHADGIEVYGPIKNQKKQEECGINPHQPKKGDGPGVAAWRQRMGTEAAQALYRLRCATAEWVNAQARNRGLYAVNVRGRRKVLAVAMLYALAHNLLRARALREAQEQPTS